MKITIQLRFKSPLTQPPCAISMCFQSPSILQSTSLRYSNVSLIFLPLHPCHPDLQPSLAFTPRRLRPTSTLRHIPTTLALALPPRPLLAPLLHGTSNSFTNLVYTFLRINRAKLLEGHAARQPS